VKFSLSETILNLCVNCSNIAIFVQVTQKIVTLEMEQHNFLSVEENSFPRFFDGKDFYCMLIRAFKKLEKYIDLINGINVFPVPDGDTGINMYQTFRSIVTEIERNKQINHCGKVISAASMGAFRGSIGNSGIILAEYFRGLEQTWKHFNTIDSVLFAKGLISAANFTIFFLQSDNQNSVFRILGIFGLIKAFTILIKKKLKIHSKEDPNRVKISFARISSNQTSHSNTKT
jgi:hypothetical protein